MGLRGAGVLAIWNNVPPALEDEFVDWHVREHMPERIGLPEFLRGRRYVAVDGSPRFFNFYEAAGVEVFLSAIYRARLDNPTEWTRRIVAGFTDTSRTVCSVAISHGNGAGAFVEAVRFSLALPAGAFLAALGSRIPSLMGEAGIVAIHLLAGEPHASGGATVERELRGAPDRVADWILLVESVAEAPLLALRSGGIGDAALAADGAARPIERGLYRLQFALDAEDLRHP